MKINDCGIHGYHEVLGIDEDEVFFFWTLLSEGDDEAAQTSYRIVLSTDAQLERNLAWDSGKVESDAQRDIRCSLPDGFSSTTTYFWQVRVWNQRDEESKSDIHDFFTAYPRSRHLPPWSMNQTYMPHSSLIFRTWFEDEANRWKGVWIGNGSDKPLYLRKTFTLVSKPARAVLFASGLGHFNLTLNGAKPQEERVLDPGWTNYHRTVQFIAIDVTKHLKQGQNAIGAHVGNGFYAGDQGDRFFWPTYEDNTYVRHGNELCFFAELHLIYEDGTKDNIISGPDWKVRKSATTLANINMSEDYDARLLPIGWDTASFDDANWDAAQPLTGPRGELRYQHQPPVTIQNIFEPKSISAVRPGTVVYDLGQNSSIMPRIAVQGSAGSKVTVRFSETIGADGLVLMPDPLFKEFENNVYCKIILAGTGSKEFWQPDFCFTSARYLQIEGVRIADSTANEDDSLSVIHSVIGQHVSSAAKPLGNMKTDKEDVNQLINACYWSYVSNIFSYHTDCPQIEKFGWLEVTHLLFPATQYFRDIESLHSKILEDILDAQEPNGFVPNMAPDTR